MGEENAMSTVAQITRRGFLGTLGTAATLAIGPRGRAAAQVGKPIHLVGG